MSDAFIHGSASPTFSSLSLKVHFIKKERGSVDLKNVRSVQSLFSHHMAKVAESIN